MKKLPKCRYFRDVTWTFINYPDNSTQQVMHCLCPKNSVAYIIKRQAYESEQGLGYQYSFACSPQSVSFTLCLLEHFSANILTFSLFLPLVVVHPNRDCGVSVRSPAGYSQLKNAPRWKRSTPTHCASARMDTSAPGDTRMSESCREKCTLRTSSASIPPIASNTSPPTHTHTNGKTNI